MLAVYC